MEYRTYEDDAIKQSSETEWKLSRKWWTILQTYCFVLSFSFSSSEFWQFFFWTKPGNSCAISFLPTRCHTSDVASSNKNSAKKLLVTLPATLFLNKKKTKQQHILSKRWVFFVVLLWLRNLDTWVKKNREIGSIEGKNDR